MEWMYRGEPLIELPEDYYGFVYLITNIKTNRKYIGKKFFYKSKTYQVKKRKKRKKVESDWKDYYGSNSELLSDIEKYGKENFTREILHLCKTKGTANYYEAKEQFLVDAIINEEYYNGWITVKVGANHIKE